MKENVLRISDVTRRVGLCVDTIYRKMRQGAFPRPIKLNHSRFVGWREHDIVDYIDKNKKNYLSW